MNYAPHKITIIRSFDQQNYFTVLVQESEFGSKIEMQTALTYDEMIGLVARICVPVNGDNQVNRHFGNPLFLEKPSMKENDANE